MSNCEGIKTITGDKFKWLEHMTKTWKNGSQIETKVQESY